MREGGGYQGGIALLEVLIATVVFTASAIALVSALGTGLRLQRESAARTQAVSLADSLLAGPGTDRSLQSGITRGTLPGGYAWRMAVAGTDQPILRAVDIALTITWHTPQGRGEYVVQTSRIVGGSP